MTRFLFNVLNCSYTSTSFRQLKCWICCIIAARCEQPFSYHVSITMLVFEQADTISFVRQWIISLYERSFIKAGVEQVVLCLHIIREGMGWLLQRSGWQIGSRATGIKMSSSLYTLCI
ncbi:uncharacterized protein [Physcomitrium patens]|uniref:uncharacterized protein isoform X3 n=1 Tax=Physcomitrium patens TaxID=3218 RepID=UPI003CCDBB25